MTKRDDKIEITQRLPTLRPISGMERKGRVWLSRRLERILKASACV
jgi:hypothetical protein